MSFIAKLDQADAMDESPVFRIATGKHSRVALQVTLLLHVPPVVLVKTPLKSRFSVVRLIIFTKVLGGSLKFLGALLVVACRHLSAIPVGLVSGGLTFSFVVHGRRPIAGECVRTDEGQKNRERKSNHMNSYTTALNQ
ncbi:hypothetical protein [Variovorax sp. EBFNA2]|uniref:hypothetical protein n=1 Tax=Variovorax sp. EBFNA2 TaxID=3342097 RepID=UPI0029BFE307|nr:hypothetical protein [Variovorax boronicumulans]WPG41149.1 hypothetical protein RZE79_34235 [Variovorax boronicumulans]